MTAHEVYISSLLVGQVVPPLVDLINKHVANSKLRFIVSIIVAGGIGVLLNLNNLNFGSLDQVLTSALVVIISAQANYKLYYENSTTQAKIRFSSSPLPLT